MNRAELVDKLAKRTGQPARVVRELLAAFGDIAIETLVEGEVFPVPRLGRVSSSWRDATVIRSVASAKRMFVDGRYTAKFKPSSDLRDAMAARGPQHWRDPAHQAAWRHAETLIADLALYHAAKAPKTLTAQSDLSDVDLACKEAFGPVWDTTRRAWAERTPEAVRDVADHLAGSARKRWSIQPSEA